MRINNAMKCLDKDTLEELNCADIDNLRGRIVQASQAIETAERELEANAEYQLIKESMVMVTAATKELRKRQRAIITVAAANLDMMTTSKG